MKRKILIALLALLVASLMTLGWYLSTPYAPKNYSLDAIKKSHASLNITDDKKYVSIKPNAASDTGIIFYPGGHVAPESYIEPMAILAETTNRPVFITKPLFNFAILSFSDADEVVQKEQGIRSWYVGGHSLGGVGAALHVSKIASDAPVKGVFFYASYPANNALKERKNVRTISIYGSKDAFVSTKKITESERLLPAETKYIRIEGMNHSQFGNYGLQEGDNPPAIPNEKAWKATAEAMKQFLGD